MNARILFTQFLAEKLPTISVSTNHAESRVLNDLPTPKAYQAELDAIANLFMNCDTVKELEALSDNITEQLGAFLNKYFLPLLSDDTQTVHPDVTAVLKDHGISTPTTQQFLAAFMNEMIASHVAVAVGKITHNTTICDDFLSRAATAFIEPHYQPITALNAALHLSNNDKKNLIDKYTAIYYEQINGSETKLSELLKKHHPDHLNMLSDMHFLFNEECLYLKKSPAKLRKLKKDYSNALDACITFMNNPNETNAEQTFREAINTFANSKHLRMRQIAGFFITLAALAILIAGIAIPITIAVATQGIAIPFFTAIATAGAATFISSIIATPLVGTALATLGFWTGYPKLEIGSRSANTASAIRKTAETII
jgi:hypothetical protein